MTRTIKCFAALAVASTLLAAPLSSSAFPAYWRDSEFDAINKYDTQAWLWDGSDNGVPVRAEYGTVGGYAYNIYNNSGAFHSVTSPVRDSRISWAIICDDYPIGDDCSPRRS